MKKMLYSINTLLIGDLDYFQLNDLMELVCSLMFKLYFQIHNDWLVQAKVLSKLFSIFCLWSLTFIRLTPIVKVMTSLQVKKEGGMG